jgi:hypothetical protein
MSKIFTATTFLLFACATCFGQTSYKGLTPGKSTRADVERVLGLPVKKISETLVEYRPQPLTSKIFVQYQTGSVVVERIEVLCRLPNSTCKDFERSLNLSLPKWSEAYKIPSGDAGYYVWYYPPPQYVVSTADYKKGIELVGSRLAFYSPELYVVAVTKALQEESTCDDGLTFAETCRVQLNVLDSNNPGHEMVTGVVKLRAPDGVIRPVADARVNFCMTSMFLSGNRYTGITDNQGRFSFYALRGTYVAIVTGPGMKWSYQEGVRVPMASAFELVAEPGDGAKPGVFDVENYLKNHRQ